MFKENLIFIIVFIFLNTITSKAEYKIQSIYNQAYQENHKKDSLNTLLKDAKNSYLLIDPFDDPTILTHIKKFKMNKNQIAGYISVGTGETFRDDYLDFKPYLASKAWSEWKDEYFISNITKQVLKLMQKRIEKMASWKIEWVEFDNMDWLTHETQKKYKLLSSPKEAQDYVNKLCHYVQSKNMKCMAKNTVEGFDSFDGVLYESYHKDKNWWDTKGTKQFLKKEKLVIINHYNEPNCDKVNQEYINYYSNKILFICEDRNLKRYKHYKR